MPRVVVLRMLIGVALTSVGLHQQAWGQEKPEAPSVATILKAINRVSAITITTAPFHEPMPFDKFLAELEKQPNVQGKFTLRIDRDAFGKDFDKVATTPVHLPETPKAFSLLTALRLAISKIDIEDIEVAYRIDTTSILITTPARARVLMTATYDVHDLLAQPRLLDVLNNERFGVTVERELERWSRQVPIREKDSGPAQDLEEDIPSRLLDRRYSDGLALELFGGPGSQRQEVEPALLRAIVRSIDLAPGKTGEEGRPSIEIVNGTRLSVRANIRQHEALTNFLGALRRSFDVAFVVQGRLYEVDDDFFRRLKNARPSHPADLEEAERRFREGKFEESALFKLLPNQKLVLEGDPVTATTGTNVAFLSRSRALGTLPSPEQVRRDRHDPQVIIDTFSFRCACLASPDRRRVIARITEQATDPQMRQLKTPDDIKHVEVDTEEVFLRQHVAAASRVLPDGGSILLPLHYRPESARKQNRHWVLELTARIVIEEEERFMRNQAVEPALPKLLDDVLTNPRLQPLRAVFGTAEEKQAALLDSPAWTWPEETTLPAGFERTLPRREGKRLLGIRIENLVAETDRKGFIATIQLSNAGGSANGAAIGTATVRYRLSPEPNAGAQRLD